MAKVPEIVAIPTPEQPGKKLYFDDNVGYYRPKFLTKDAAKAMG